MIDERLMRNLMRAAGTARRHPHTDGTKPQHPPKGRGFGHILDLLGSEGVSQQYIADTLGIRPQSVSEAISVLESRGFVTKQPSENDKRKTLIFITEEGLGHRQLMAQHRKEHAAQLFSVLTDEEKQQFAHLLEKINGAFENNGGTL